MLQSLNSLFSRFVISAPVSLTAGLAASYAMAPNNLWPMLFISFPLLYLCIHFAKDKKRAFVYGWLFGFGYFLLGLSWIGNALLVEGNPYKWAWPLAVSGLPLALAFFTGFAALASKLLPLNRATGYCGFVLFFAGAEILRGHIFTGFPWNLYGYTWADIPEIIQVVSLGTTYVLTALTILWAGAGALLFISARTTALPILAIAALSFVVCFVYGAQRLNSTTIDTHDSIQIHMVQPNIAQADKWDPYKISRHFEKLVSLSSYRAERHGDKTTYIVWPENRDQGLVCERPDCARRHPKHAQRISRRGAAFYRGAAL